MMGHRHSLIKSCHQTLPLRRAVSTQVWKPTVTAICQPMTMYTHQMVKEGMGGRVHDRVSTWSSTSAIE